MRTAPAPTPPAQLGAGRCDVLLSESQIEVAGGADTHILLSKEIFHIFWGTAFNVSVRLRPTDQVRMEGLPTALFLLAGTGCCWAG